MSFAVRSGADCTPTTLRLIEFFVIIQRQSIPFESTLSFPCFPLLESNHFPLVKIVAHIGSVSLCNLWIPPPPPYVVTCDAHSPCHIGPVGMALGWFCHVARLACYICLCQGRRSLRQHPMDRREFVILRGSRVAHLGDNGADRRKWRMSRFEESKHLRTSDSREVGTGLTVPNSDVDSIR